MHDGERHQAAVSLLLGWVSETETGDILHRASADPVSAANPFGVHPNYKSVTKNTPHLHAGYRHAWENENQSLLIAGYLKSHLRLDDEDYLVPNQSGDAYRLR